MNEFLNHQIAHNAVFVYVEADLGDFVFETLKERFAGKVLLNPSAKEYPGILEQAFQKYIIDESQMFRYAGRRHVKDDILTIIQNQTTIKLRTEK